MPVIIGAEPALEPAPPITGVVAAVPGLQVEVYAPKGTSTSGIPAASRVVAWASVADPACAGGVRVDPVFLADGRTWTPDQFRAAYGETLTLSVVPV